MAIESVFAVRGAVTVERDSPDEIQSKTLELWRELAEKNGLNSECEAISVVVSSTSDIKSFYPVRALREAGVTKAPLFSTVEPDIEESLKLCVRLLVTVVSRKERKEGVHVYLGGAKTLRPDLN